MHTLYYAPGAASMAVHWLLLELGLPHQLVSVDLEAGEQKRPEYLALNPNGVVPTLLIDGTAHGEAAALMLHLADSHPGAGLAPAPDSSRRAEFLQWMFHMANAVQPLFRQWWYPHEPAGANHADAVRAHAEPRIAAEWDRLDRHLADSGPWLLGRSLSAADFYLAMLVRWSRKMQRPGTQWSHLAALAGKLKSRPSYAVLRDREGLDEW
ncbi:glutathione S-transferase family protein [Luteimonas vadosa]|uniref:Glutathione S-transferase family protein n=1 Tax=Luteimonas vadosa TaxID=1165507 RepID=A0ABP9E3J8_9GAMM